MVDLPTFISIDLKMLKIWLFIYIHKTKETCKTLDLENRITVFFLLQMNIFIAIVWLSWDDEKIRKIKVEFITGLLQFLKTLILWSCINMLTSFIDLYW
jgi:hypothetical protein